MKKELVLIRRNSIIVKRFDWIAFDFGENESVPGVNWTVAWTWKLNRLTQQGRKQCVMFWCHWQSLKEILLERIQEAEESRRTGTKESWSPSPELLLL